MEQPAFDAPAAEWLVYSDALQQAGNPRGELIALSHAVAEGRAEPATRDAHVRKHWNVLLGKCPPHTNAYDLEWHYGLVRAATVRVQRGMPDPVGPLLEAPAAAELRAITLRGAFDDRPFNLTPKMHKLATHAPASCRSFAFVDERATRAAMLVSPEYSPAPNLVQLGPLQPFWARATALSLDVADSLQLELGDISAPELRSFALRCLRFTDPARQMTQRLAAARWPKLETLELRLVEEWIANVPLERAPYEPVYSTRAGDDEEDEPSYDDPDEGEPVGTDWRSLEPVLRTLAACPLRRLALTSFASSRSLLEVLAAAPLPATLEELDLSDSATSNGDVDWLLRHGDRLRSLRRLIVERTAIDPAGADRLRSLGPEIVHSTAGAPSYRYVVGQE
jgi:uncharacterized protein (TIGR02996 family)